ncbi:hypothetical protein NC653_018161 [Populus alba x Populus x berolinensis]|uniref:Uncharacterized protein n=1 Tax=Populus alba x Populus x berolinensis TaxID=444605 RepID=A0AAD6QFV5_9ROSI|nr:hypothetical protein NC653_018161 [Populus alba x Populus x berolinensis]
MSKGPVLFADIGNKAKDLLTKDYNSDQRLSVSTFSDAGVALTSSAVKIGGLSTGDVAALYMYKNTIFNVQIDTESNISTTLTFTGFLPSTKTIASIKFPDYNSGKGGGMSGPSRRGLGVFPKGKGFSSRRLSIHLVRLGPRCLRPARAVLGCLAGERVVIVSCASPFWRQRGLTGVYEGEFFY